MAAASQSASQGYPKEIFVDSKINTKYLCGICNLILRNPVQNSCGHRFCKDCLDDAVNNANGQKVICLACQKENNVDDTSLLNSDESYADNAVKRELAKVQCKCINSGCTWTGLFKEFEDHVKTCEHALVTCEICNKQVPRHQNLESDVIQSNHSLEEHKESHSQLQECPFKCSLQESDKNVKEHMSSHIVDHLNIIQRRLVALETDSASRPRAAALASDDAGASQRIRNLESSVEGLKVAVRSGGGVRALGGNAAASIGNDDLGNRFKIYDDVLTVINGEVEKLYNQVDTTNKNQTEERRKLGSLEERVVTLERTLAMKEAVIAELDTKVASLEQTSYTGVLLWKINNMAQRRQDAISGKVPSIYSTPFFTSKTGYKMCARLYLNGDGTGKGTHVSLFFVIMRGQFDPLLKWPFKQKVTLIFIDQNNRDQVIDAFYPDSTSSSFQQPTTEMNIASGCPKFMPLINLDNTSRGYVKDDNSFIKVIVSLEGLE